MEQRTSNYENIWRKNTKLLQNSSLGSTFTKLWNSLRIRYSHHKLFLCLCSFSRMDVNYFQGIDCGFASHSFDSCKKRKLTNLIVVVVVTKFPLLMFMIQVDWILSCRVTLHYTQYVDVRSGSNLCSMFIRSTFLVKTLVGHLLYACSSGPRVEAPTCVHLKALFVLDVGFCFQKQTFVSRFQFLRNFSKTVDRKGK